MAKQNEAARAHVGERRTGRRGLVATLVALTIIGVVVWLLMNQQES